MKRLSTFRSFLAFLIPAFCMLPGYGFTIHQPFNKLYDDSELPSVFVTLDEDSLNQMLLEDNWFEDHEYPATMIFVHSSGSDTLTNIGFRLRGNTSRRAQKKSFKIAINSFEKGRKYQGVEKINLNGEHNDPSIIRSKIAWDVLKEMNVPAPRANHVKLYVNNSYYGLYINVEHIDEEFIQSRFGTKSGSLFKCTYPADLTYRGTDINAYKAKEYELKFGDENASFKKLANFLDTLNNTPLNDRECAFDRNMNMSSFLKSMAFDVLSGNWDGPLYNMNNFYLYFNPIDHKVHYIPFDLDNTFGIDWIGRDWDTRNIYSWSRGGNNRPLYTKVLENDRLKYRYGYAVEYALENAFDTSLIFKRIDKLKTLIQDAAEADEYRKLDYGFTIADFNTSYTKKLSGHVSRGLKEFIENRNTSAENQLGTTAPTGFVQMVQVSPTGNGSAIATVWAEEVEEIQCLAFYYPENEVSMVYMTLEDGRYVAEVDLRNRSHVYLTFVLNAISGDFPFPCGRMPARFDLESPWKSKVFINELVADNGSGIQDESGKEEDWIELYNASSESINLNGWYLTDDPDNPQKWEIKNMEMTAKSFSLFWADDDEEEGLNHTNFKLSKDGEYVGLFDPNGLLVDEIVFGPMEEDKSYGRKTDADSTWLHFDAPTPNASNGRNSLVVNRNVSSLTISPNPSNGRFVFNSSAKLKYIVLDSKGQEVKTGEDTEIDLSTMPSALYYINVLSLDGERLCFKVALID